MRLTVSLRPYSLTSYCTIPTLLIINISLAAFVFSRVLPERQSEIQRYNVDESVINSNFFTFQANARFRPLMAASNSAKLIWHASSFRNQLASSTMCPPISMTTLRAKERASTHTVASLLWTSHFPRTGLFLLISLTVSYMKPLTSSTSSHLSVTQLALRLMKAVATLSQPHTG